MSTTIPYDPSLALGNIVPQAHLDVLEKISSYQTPIDASLQELNSAILLKRKLQMTQFELANMDVDVSKVVNAMKEVDKELASAAAKYAETSVENLPKIAAERAKIAQVSQNVESPIDYNKSQIKTLPISADSLTLDSQYFSFDEESQSSESVMASMKSFVQNSTSSVGSSNSEAASAAVQSQVNHQREHHEIQGTLVITASCTHKQAELFAPFIIDVDKGIRAWNEIFPNDQIKTNSPASLLKIAVEQGTKQAQFFNLLSGATYGSSFVGCVHILKNSGSSSSQSMYSLADSFQSSFELNGWVGNETGSFGVSSSFSDSAKSILSNQKISAHISIVCMGVIPTIEANNVQLAVKQFSDFSPDKMMGQLATLQNATASEQQSIAQSADSARTGNQMNTLQATKISSVMSAVSETDDGQNKILDINSMMTAFTDYVNKAIAGECGVPINYYLKPITASQLAQMWVAKYYPGKFITSAGDDSDPKEPNQSSGSGGDSGDDGS